MIVNRCRGDSSALVGVQFPFLQLQLLVGDPFLVDPFPLIGYGKVIVGFVFAGKFVAVKFDRLYYEVLGSRGCVGELRNPVAIDPLVDRPCHGLQRRCNKQGKHQNVANAAHFQAADLLPCIVHRKGGSVKVSHHHKKAVRRQL